MAAVCKPGGQLILLQHGRAKWGWLNRTLDEEAPAHFAKWGCWWNRDILELVHEVCSETSTELYRGIYARGHDFFCAYT